MIEYQVHSGSSTDEALVARYWAKDENGKFIEPINSLIPYGSLKNSQQLAKFINEVSSAWDTDQSCPNCQGHSLLRSRSEVKSRLGQIYSICDACKDKEADKLKIAEKEKFDELARRLIAVSERNLAATIEYEQIPIDVVLILIALDRVLNPRLITGSFMRSECQGLVPADSDLFVQRLWAAGVILDLPSKAQPDAYFLKDEKLWHYNDKVACFLVPDEQLGKDETAFGFLAGRDFSGCSELRQLWLDYAVCDCLAYLFDQCALHKLETSSEDDVEIKSILRTALQVHSIAQIWSVVWKVVRDAASLSTREYYNRVKAVATIPGKISRQIERVVKSGAPMNSWRRPADQPAGALGDVFYEYFGIDEDTTGIEVMSAFANQVDEDEPVDVNPPLDLIEEQACTLMRRAIAHNVEAEVILLFADRIRDGDHVQKALDAVFAAHPRLNE